MTVAIGVSGLASGWLSPKVQCLQCPVAVQSLGNVSCTLITDTTAGSRQVTQSCTSGQQLEDDTRLKLCSYWWVYEDTSTVLLYCIGVGQCM